MTTALGRVHEIRPSGKAIRGLSPKPMYIHSKPKKKRNTPAIMPVIIANTLIAVFMVISPVGIQRNAED